MAEHGEEPAARDLVLGVAVVLAEGLKRSLDLLEARFDLRWQLVQVGVTLDKPVIFAAERGDLRRVVRRAFDVARIDPRQSVAGRIVDVGLRPLPPPTCSGVLGQDRELLENQPVQQGHVVQPAAPVVGEEVAGHGSPRRFIGLGADEHGAAVARLDLGGGQRLADVGGRAVVGELLVDLFLPGMVVGDREGHELVETQVLGPAKVDQARTEIGQPQALANHPGADAEPRGDFLGAPALALVKVAEGFELVGGMHGRAGDVFVQADLPGVQLGFNHAGDGAGLADDLAQRQQLHRLPAPLADGDQPEAGRLAAVVEFRFDDRLLQHLLGRDACRQRLDGLGAVRGLAGVPGRGLELVEGNVDLGARDDLNFGHDDLLWGLGCQAHARLTPCPSARPGVQAEAPLRGEPAAGPLPDTADVFRLAKGTEAGRKRRRSAPRAEP